MNPYLKNLIELVFFTIFVLVGGGMMTQGATVIRGEPIIGIGYLVAGSLIILVNLDRMAERWKKL